MMSALVSMDTPRSKPNAWGREKQGMAIARLFWHTSLDKVGSTIDLANAAKINMT